MTLIVKRPGHDDARVSMPFTLRGDQPSGYPDWKK